MGRHRQLNSNFLRQPIIVALCLSVLIGFIIVVGKYMGFLQSTELGAYDFIFRQKPVNHLTKQRVVIVGIAEKDIRKFGQWPITDGALSEMLHTLLSYKPRAIGVDIYRDVPVPPGTDELSRILIQNDNIFVVEKFGASGEFPISAPRIMQDTDQLGFADMPVDFDGVVRKGLLFLDDGNNISYSLSLRLALHYLKAKQIYPSVGIPDPTHLRLGNATIRPFESNDGAYVQADARGYQYLLDLEGGPQPFESILVSDLLTGQVLANTIANKIVILGVIANSVKDYFLTPYRKGFGATTEMPGIVLHAHAANQLLRLALNDTRQLMFLKEWQEYGYIFLWSIAGILIGLYVRTMFLFVAALIFGCGILFGAAYGALLMQWWIPLVPPMLAWLAASALMAAYLSGYESVQKKTVMDLFSRHVSPSVAQEIWKQREKFSAGGRLESREETATVLFSDLEDFTPLSEALGPVKLMRWLNEYMNIMANAVMHHGGFVDDYYGDAIKANFGIPVGNDTKEGQINNACNAVRCALAMRLAMNELNTQWSQQGLPEIRMRIGIATGSVVAGCIGSSQRMKYTTVGDTVNTAARLESYDKKLAKSIEEGYCRILIDDLTAQYVNPLFIVKPIDPILLKGKTKSVRVYRLEGEIIPEVSA